MPARVYETDERERRLWITSLGTEAQTNNKPVRQPVWQQNHTLVKRTAPPDRKPKTTEITQIESTLSQIQRFENDLNDPTCRLAPKTIAPIQGFENDLNDPTCMLAPKTIAQYKDTKTI